MARLSALSRAPTTAGTLAQERGAFCPAQAASSNLHGETMGKREELTVILRLEPFSENGRDLAPDLRTAPVGFFSVPLHRLFTGKSLRVLW